MNTKITEYKEMPELSQEARNFVDTFTGGEIPPNIRTELEKYLKDIEPHVVQSKARLNKLFKSAFKK